MPGIDFGAVTPRENRRAEMAAHQKENVASYENFAQHYDFTGFVSAGRRDLVAMAVS